MSESVDRFLDVTQQMARAKLLLEAAEGPQYGLTAVSYPPLSSAQALAAASHNRARLIKAHNELQMLKRTPEVLKRAREIGVPLVREVIAQGADAAHRRGEIVGDFANRVWFNAARQLHFNQSEVPFFDLPAAFRAQKLADVPIRSYIEFASDNRVLMDGWPMVSGRSSDAQQRNRLLRTFFNHPDAPTGVEFRTIWEATYGDIPAEGNARRLFSYALTQVQLPEITEHRHIASKLPGRWSNWRINPQVTITLQGEPAES